VAACFLMISEVTGESKGYGLVKYISSEAAAQAKHLLTGKEVGNRAGVLFTSVVDPHRFDADPDPTFHFDADPEPDPDPTP
jgi:hypothetical protein